MDSALKLQIKQRNSCGGYQKSNPFVHRFTREDKRLQCGPLDGEENLTNTIGEAGIEGCAEDMEASKHGPLQNVLNMGEAFVGNVRDIQDKGGYYRRMLICGHVQKSGSLIIQRIRYTVAIPLQEFDCCRCASFPILRTGYLAVESVEIGGAASQRTIGMTMDKSFSHDVTPAIVLSLQQCQLQGVGSTLPHVERLLYTLENMVFLQRNIKPLQLRTCLDYAGDLLIDV
ncbi:hypothetical protein MVEG_05062 [Podila verticillata NRRL 6337]|nr:hypothetical protein MVEG_05062 [Podila verticillata NRRL 6337]